MDMTPWPRKVARCLLWIALLYTLTFFLAPLAAHYLTAG